MDVSKSDKRIKDVSGQYEFYTKFNGRSAFKHTSSNYFLFFVDKNNTSGNSRWVIEDLLGKVKVPSGGEYLGIIRHEGEEKCPSEVGKKWNQIWNHTSIDPNITVTCAGEVKEGDFLFCIDCENATIFFLLLIEYKYQYV